MLRFSEILANPHNFDPKTLGFLQKVVDDSPYCQPARMLYAKALMEVDKMRFEKEVKRAMAAALSRRLFRKYLSEKAEEPGAAQKEKDRQSSPAVSVRKKEETASGTALDSRSEEEKRRRQQSIIDRFLEAEPRIQPARAAVPEGELAQESVEDNPELISETLAEVLLKQGKKESAIVIYKKLSLMFPEKSSYFAKKLERIQKEAY